MNTFYTTIENQVRSDGSRGLLYDHFDDESQAYAKYFTVCAAAAVSGIPYHAAHIIRSDGIMIEGRVWDRRQETPAAANETEE
ncbi:MAG: hypothetical protein IKH57_05030 [Clostridia bacterium]|nr:hypothetical protein [Clostridia bacterium]MBR3106092.1 hypothetical protein [Clostridia bacterium]